VPALQRMKTLGKLTVDVPTAALVVAIVPDASVIPAAPVRVLQTFMSFADEVDGYMPDTLPSVFQAHTTTYEVEALPWD
jgi:hypothetical protein